MSAPISLLRGLALRDVLPPGAWLDWDVAMYRLACAAGLMDSSLRPLDEEDYEEFREKKGEFWTNTPLSLRLADSLDAYAAAGLLEYDPELTAYRLAE